jgi:hypothetical protein
MGCRLDRCLSILACEDSFSVFDCGAAAGHDCSLGKPRLKRRWAVCVGRLYWCRISVSSSLRDDRKGDSTPR